MSEAAHDNYDIGEKPWMFQLSDSKLWVLEAGSSQIFLQGEMILVFVKSYLNIFSSLLMNQSGLSDFISSTIKRRDLIYCARRVSGITLISYTRNQNIRKPKNVKVFRSK